MLTFKEFVTEATNPDETKQKLAILANHPNTGEHEKSAAKSALERLNKPKEPEKPSISQPKEKKVIHPAGIWKLTHMHLKPNGERRYTSHNENTKLYKTHNRSETEVRYHPSENAAHKHLHDQGYTKRVTAGDHNKSSYIDNKMSTAKGSKKKFTSGKPGAMQRWQNSMSVGGEEKKPKFHGKDDNKTTVKHKKDGKKWTTTQG